MATKRSGASPKKGSLRKSAAKNEGSNPPASLPGQPPSVTEPSATEAEIRRRAYELYEMRGRADGFDREDWTQAEAEVLSRLWKKESA